MKYIGYIFLAISLFIIGFAVYLLARDKSEARKKTLSSLEKARKAKSEKAELRKLQRELEDVPEVDIPDESPTESLEYLSNQIIDENATKKEN